MISRIIELWEGDAARECFHAFVLDYRVAPSRHPKPLLDITRAMCLIRENAESWKVDSDKIAVCGFSAGGHLAASLGVHWQKDYLKSVPGAAEGLNRPNALILCYPVISPEYMTAKTESFKNLLDDDAGEELKNELSLDRQINGQTPPSFLWHTFADDGVLVMNSLQFAKGLASNNIPFELHVYPEGAHGLSLATEETAMAGREPDTHVSTWMKLCIEWLKGIF